MKLTKLELKNFRCFNELSIEFDPRLTVLVAPNGQGKTAILDAVRIALWSYVSAFDVVSGAMPNSGIGIGDVTLHRSSRGNMEPRLPSTISAKADHAGRHLSWSRKREKVSAGSRTSVTEAMPIANLGRVLQSAIRVTSEDETEESHPDIQLPIIAHYGTARLWKQRKRTSADAKSGIARLFANGGVHRRSSE